MKKILIGLLILFTLFNNSNCMEENSHKRKGHPSDQKIAEPKLKKNRLPDSPDENYDGEHFEFFQSLPPELRHIIITTILEENITSWDDIFKLDRKSLKEILNNITLISKDFLVLEKEELKNFIINLKKNRFAYIQERIKDLYKDVSKKELNKKLTDLLKVKMSLNDLEESVRLIIAGADINIKDNNDWTALLNAAHFGHPEIVRLLIDAGADINIKDKYGQTALMLAALNGHTQTAKLLIDAGADINTKGNNDWTALIMAAYYGHTEIVRLLIDAAGADINIKDSSGGTALMFAALNGHTQTAKLLIDAGANINIKDDSGWTALIMAANKGHLEIVRLLIDKGADINIRDNIDWTALMWAASFSHTEIVKLLSKQDQSFFTSSCILQ